MEANQKQCPHDQVVFLDVDGVLNSKKTNARLNGYVGLDRERIAVLNKLIERVPTLKFVVSSMWRYHYEIPELERLLRENGLVGGEFVGHTPMDPSQRHRGKTRGQEIADWMEANGTPRRFAALDDDTEMEPVNARHVLTTWEQGLLESHLDRATELLTQE